jgi:hypothetical protein
MNARAEPCATCGNPTFREEICQGCALDAERAAPTDPDAAALSLDDAIEQLPGDAEDARYHARQARELLKAHQEAER